MDFLLPCLIFYNVLSSLDSSDLASLGVMLLSAVLFQFIGLGFGYICKFTTGCPKYWKGGLLASGVFANVNDFPIAYITTLSTSTYFQAEDSTRGTAYALIFVAWTIFALFNCSGYRIIGSDMTRKHRDMINNVPYDHLAQNQLPILKLWGIMTKNLKLSRKLRNDSLSNTGVQLNDPHEKSHSSTCDDSTAYIETAEIAEISEISDSIIQSIHENVDIKFLDRAHRYFARHNINFIWELFSNFGRPAIISLFVALILTMFPSSRRVFYEAPDAPLKNFPNAPDGAPILGFVMDITKFVGNCCVPLGLLILGATVSRISMRKMPAGYWKTVVLMTILKLIVLPIVAIAWSYKVRDLGWIEKDNYMAVFVLVIASSAPAATVQVYMTAMLAPPGFEDSEAISCIAIQVVVQYVVLLVTMPIVLTYTIKRVLGF